MGTYDLTLRLAQLAGQEGRRDEAAFRYAEILCGNPYLIEAWWGLSQTVHDPAQAQYCLGRVLAITPYHSLVGQRLKEQARRLYLPPVANFGPWPSIDRRGVVDRRAPVDRRRQTERRRAS